MIFVYVPCQNVDTAKNIAKTLVQEKIAGSVDILHADFVNIENEKVMENSGAVMIVKTIEKHVQEIEDIVREKYQNGIPCIATISLYRLNRDFKDWLLTSVG